MLIDTHCHLTFGKLASQIGAVLERAREAGVERVINVATTLEEAGTGLELLSEFENVYLVAGIHPHEAGKCDQDDLNALATLHRGQWRGEADQCRLVGIGETGLDFHYDFAPRAQQEKVFCGQLELGCELQRPVVIHARQAEQRACEILADYPLLTGRVVFHCYSAGIAIARQILDLGGSLSFTGVVTFRNAETVRRSAGYAPLERIMLETDAPFLSPEPMRNIQPNEPALLVHTARFLAKLRGESYERIADATTSNAVNFFGLPKE